MSAEVRAKPRFSAETRLLTGVGHAHRGYVQDRMTGRVPEACQHYHRSQARAQECAKKLLLAVRERFDVR